MSQGETGGVFDSGTAEEEDPVTWETPNVHRASPGHGAPVIHSDASAGNELTGGRPPCVVQAAQNQGSSQW